MLDFVLLILALIFGPAMVYEMWAARRRAQGDEVPTLPQVVGPAWAAARPWVELVGYGVKRLIAFNWQPTPADLPRLLRGPVADDGDDEDSADAAPLPALVPAPTGDPLRRLRSDRSRAAVVEVLVQAGWDVGAIRAVLKGDNGAIGAETQAARAALGSAAPPARTFVAREHVGGVRMEREIALD
jgi:hypothetical protein